MVWKPRGPPLLFGLQLWVSVLRQNLQPPRRFSYTPRRRNGEDVTDTSLCCAPIINLWGAYWPAWVLCLVCGIVLTLVSRLIFSWTRLEPHLGPLLLVYPMLIVAYACGLWLLLYRA
jgi:hypothetical protein